MGVREQVVDSLRRGEFAALALQAAAQPRVLRVLVGRLWDAEEVLRAGAARTLGELAARQPEKATELVRRFLWALNDESGTNGAAVVPALGAMAKAAPAVVGPFAGALAAHLEDDGMRADLLQVLATLKAAGPAWIEPHAAQIARWELQQSGGGLPPGGEEVWE
jgi:hypothetical protein